MLVFHFSPGTSSMAAHIALHEVGCAFESRVLSFHRTETRTPQFLKINPVGQVPVLEVDGRVLTEVAAILFYLARRYPEAGLLPAGDAFAEAEVISWMSFVAATLHPAHRQGIEHMRDVYALADRRLGEREWAIGGRYSIADIHLFRLFWRNRGRLKLGAGELPNLVSHYERMMERRAVVKTIEVESGVGYELPS